MTVENRVVWAEGMFLRTQHFQQQDRYTESLVRAAVRGLIGHGWGFETLRLNTSLLGTGKVAIAEATGVLPDGTPFAIPEQVDHPEPLAVSEATREGVVYLALPELQPGAIEIDPEGAPDSGARYRGHALELRDTIANIDGQALVQLAKLNVRLMHHDEERGGYVCMGVARIKGVQTDGAVVLDNDYIPPCLSVSAHGIFGEFLSELEGKLQSIAQDRVRYIDGRGQGAADLRDLLMLQIVNRVAPLITHLREQQILHPKDLFAVLVSLIGECSTYATSERVAPPLPSYRHHDLAGSFRPVMDLLRSLLVGLGRPDRKAMPIPLHLHRSGVRTTEVPDVQLFSRASFILAVKADMPAEKVRQMFPRQATIGPVEDFQDLWMSRLSGIEATPVPVAPPQIPYHTGMSYFDLDRSSQYWKKLPKSTGLAIGLTGDFPGLEIECWAIRE
jgi:type VI secretion system protein ImpJ